MTIIIFPGGGFNGLAIDFEGTEICNWLVMRGIRCVLEFSAGGYMVPHLSTHFKQRAYFPIDAADKESCRPDFAIPLYLGHMEKKKGED